MTGCRRKGDVESASTASASGRGVHFVGWGGVVRDILLDAARLVAYVRTCDALEMHTAKAFENF